MSETQFIGNILSDEMDSQTKDFEILSKKNNHNNINSENNPSFSSSAFSFRIREQKLIEDHKNLFMRSSSAPPILPEYNISVLINYKIF